MLEETFKNINIIPFCPKKTDVLIVAPNNQKYTVKDLKNPDHVSNWMKDIGFNHERTKLICYSGEPFLDGQSAGSFLKYFDGVITHDLNTHNGRNVRIPYWYWHIDWYNKNDSAKYDEEQAGHPTMLHRIKDFSDNKFLNKTKNKFGCSVYSNDTYPRMQVADAFKFQWKKIDEYGESIPKPTYELALGKKTRKKISLGQHWVEGWEKKKMEVMCKYKFNICFENTLQSGYHTEKLLQAKYAGCIPLYYGHHTAAIDFNTKCFINFADFKNIEDFIDYVEEVDTNKSLYNKIIKEPLFNKTPDIKRTQEKIRNLICK